MSKYSETKYPLLTHNPQLIPLQNLYCDADIIVYRDDPEDFAFGGNKVRFYEYLIPQIIAEKPDVLVSSGSIHSNHIRVTAQVCTKLGIPCELLITADAPENGSAPTANVAFAEAADATIHYIGTFAALLKIREFVSELEKQGKKVFLVPNGGHTPGAIRAYSDVLEFALNGLNDMGLAPDYIFLPCSSGTTHAGLIFGEARLGISAPVISFAVANTPRGAARGVSQLLNDASAVYSDAGKAAGADVQVLDCGKNDYGTPDEELLRLRDGLNAAEDILLDRVYNINAFRGMIDYLSAIPANGTALYIDTGGYRF